MSALPIVCDNCGAKYRLPESFQGDKAKCKACGSVIDVAAQRRSAAEPSAAAGRPAAAPAAKPATAQPAREARTARADRARPDAEPRARGRQRDEAATAGGDGKRRGHRERGAPDGSKKGGSMLLIGGSVGALAVLAVIAVLLLNKGSGAKESEQTAAASTGKSAAAPAGAREASADQQPAKAAEAAAPKAADPAAAGSAAAEPAAQPAPQPGDPAADKPAEKPAEGPVSPSERWKLRPVRSMGEVFDPKTLGEIRWPADATDAVKTEVRGLVEDVLGGGITGVRAKPKLEQIGFHSMFGIVEALRDLDYTSVEGNMTGYELNKVLDSIAAGINTGFLTVEATEDLDPRKADYNATTVKVWMGFLGQHENKAAFDKWRKERLAKAEKK